ncbi:Telomerase reverse transcriptase [Naganishia albida]|nr:Telomerase reverse transcriptase [Naganishia albida]
MSTSSPSSFPAVYHPTISEYYPLVIRLKDYLKCLINLQDWSEVFGISADASKDAEVHEQYLELIGGVLLSFGNPQATMIEDSWNSGGERRIGQQVQNQVDLVSNVLMKLFRRATQRRPMAKLSEIDVLLKGYVRGGEGKTPYAGLSRDRPGLSRQNVNNCERLLQTSPAWKELHRRIGTDLMLHILTESTIFIPQANNCYLQLSGIPIDGLSILAKIEKEKRTLEAIERKREAKEEAQRARKRRKLRNGIARCEFEGREEGRQLEEVLEDVRKGDAGQKSLSRHASTASAAEGGIALIVRSPIDVTIPRMKMFYARHPLRKQPKSAFRGLPDRHILNTVKSAPPRSALPAPSDPSFATLSSRYDMHEEARMLLRYVFPREHKLENVWDWRKREDRYTKAVLPEYRDWSNREEELLTQVSGASGDVVNTRWQTPPHEVIRYARAVVQTVMPAPFWGTKGNGKVINDGIRKIVLGKRYETFSMHHMLQGIASDKISWLSSSREDPSRLNASEHVKRRQLVDELAFWFYDGFLIPLIRNAFYVTETGTTRNKTVYFRLDDWAEVCKPVLRSLRHDNLKKLSQGRQNALKQAPQPYTVHRLVPKAKGLRPIANLGKRIKLVQADGSAKWLPSINQTLESPYDALNLIKLAHPELMKSALLGLGDIHPKLKAFKQRLLQRHGTIPKLHFVKVDVKSAFDSIDLEKLFNVLKKIFNTDDQYISRKYVRMLPSTGRKPKKYGSVAHSRQDVEPFHSRLFHSTENLRNAVLLDQVQMSSHFGEQIMQTLKSHLREHLVKIGPEFYKQKTGIPQGSKVSSLLCTLYYGHMEQAHLSFVHDKNSLLLRMIDDFLLVTTDFSQADKFLQVMQAGFPDYGCHIAPEKSLASFRPTKNPDATTICADRYFTYCGFAIDTRDLDISIDLSRKFDMHSKDAFSAKYVRHIGQAFRQWLCRVLENYNSILLNDTTLSSMATVVGNIYANFTMAAMRCVNYLVDVDYLAQGNLDLIITAIQEAIKQTCRSNRTHVKHGSRSGPSTTCMISDNTFLWLGTHAFERIFVLKGPYFAGVVPMLQSQLRSPSFRWIRRQAHLLKAVDVAWGRLSAIPF